MAGLTTIAATCGVASGAVLPHDQLDSAATTTVASVRPLPDMISLLPRTAPHHRKRDVRRGELAFDESSYRHQAARRCRSPSILNADATPLCVGARMKLHSARISDVSHSAGARNASAAHPRRRARGNTRARQ